MEETNEDKTYKLNDASTPMDIYKEIKQDLEKSKEESKDSVFIAVLLTKLVYERENTNRILKNLLNRIEALELKLAEKSVLAKETLMLPEVDEAIVAFLKEGPKTAEDVQRKFGYKGKNAASARLNRLHSLGVVVKQQVGKKVYFSLA